ncbi:Cyclopentanone 1,2-monooxygenase [Termitomyces sp. J132]|nr:Cyclopentanone 1,2-monooxygenase [Termitomyces sp. J132]
MTGKRVGVIGTGASGVQVIQEAGPIVTHLTVFQRTPNLALPMNQSPISVATQTKMKKEKYPILFKRRLQTFAGFHYDNVPLGTRCTMSPEEREKVLERIQDPGMQRKLAPEKPPHPFGVKRISLEQSYYEVFNRPNVDLIDVNENPIIEITPKGVKMQDGAVHELDVLVLATGFDALTGSISQIDIKGMDGISIGDKWKQGLSTYLGMTVAGFPNMFFPYGPHGPTAFCNGPTCAELQGDWIVDCLTYLRQHNYTRIEATQEGSEAWVRRVGNIFSKGLFGHAKSWYRGANVPGKRVEPLNFTGGVPLYANIIQESARGGYTDFTLTSATNTQASYKL